MCNIRVTLLHIIKPDAYPLLAQNDLLNFVTDKQTISKAVEGSMQKRVDGLDAEVIHKGA